MQVQPLGQEDAPEEGMPTHSSTLAWRIPWTEESGGLQSMGVTKSQTRRSTVTTLTVHLFCARHPSKHLTCSFIPHIPYQHPHLIDEEPKAPGS